MLNCYPGAVVVLFVLTLWCHVTLSSEFKILHVHTEFYVGLLLLSPDSADCKSSWKTPGWSRVCCSCRFSPEINLTVLTSLLVCSSRRSAAAVRPADEARAAGRHRHAGRLPVERRREFQRKLQRRLDHQEKRKTVWVYFCLSKLFNRIICEKFVVTVVAVFLMLVIRLLHR